jgi:cytochrome b pre-mRNA-processing protein 3
VAALSAYLIQTRAALAEQSLDALLQGDVTWPNP